MKMKWGGKYLEKQRGMLDEMGKHGGNQRGMLDEMGKH